MIYTVTFNPSLDYIVSVSDFKLGLTNRTDSELLLPGGKGINVSTVLQNLGIANTAFGFTAGFVGEEVRKEVEQLGVKAEFISLDEGVSRINLKLKSIDGTEINGRGPKIPREAVDALMTQLDRLGADDTLVLAGSIPASMPDDIYQKIINKNATDEAVMSLSKVVTVIIGIVVICFGVFQPGSIFEINLFAFSGMAIFVVPILFGIYWKKATAKGAIASVIVGIISLLLFTLNPSVKALAMGFHALFPTTIIASIVMIVVSKFTETPPQETIDRHFTV